MKQVKKSVLLWHTPHEMYELVTQVERYPEFLPWCNKVEVLAREGDSKHILYPPMGCCHFQVDHQSTSVMSNARKASKDHEYLGVTLPLQSDRASPR